MRLRPSSWLAAAVVSSLAPMRSATADSLVSLPDPAYAEVRPLQRHPLRPHIHQLIYPTIGLPALVTVGGTGEGAGGFDIWVRGRHSTDVNVWRIVVATDATADDGPWFELLPLKVDVDPGAGVTRLRVALPATAPRDIYNLQLYGPAGLSEKQPRAVRVLGPARGEFRFAMMSDHQLWDPSWKVSTESDRNLGDYPRRGEVDRNRAAARQGWHELELLDPDFVLYGGDLVFGLDYPAEMDEAYRLWAPNRIATFFVPGNHDGYARYEVHLKGGVATVGASLLLCKGKLDGSLTWAKVWSYVTCAYGDVRQFLFHDLLEDGLAYYQTTFGPPYYSFDAGKLHVIALNTYAGTPERRHSFSIYVDLFDLHLGAPAVDNYGGYLTDAELDWLEADAARARRDGKTVVVFGHHDPRGNRDAPPERRYSVDNPFPTDPISLEGFQEWNYEGALWDSDPHDRRAAEAPLAHSGTRLLRLLAKHADYVLLGHRHADDHVIYEAGDEVAPGVRAERRLEFVRVTAAAGAPKEGNYWGYRMFQVHDGRIVDTNDYDYAHGLGSTPLGNLWVDRAQGASASQALQVVNALPRPAETTLRFRLPVAAEGWRFVETGSGFDLPLRTVAPLSSGQALYYVGFTAPRGLSFPPGPGTAARRTVTAVPAGGNHPPVPAIAVSPLPLVAGAPLQLSGAGSTDPDGDPIIAYRWELPSGPRIGPSIQETFAAPGNYRVVLEVVDGRGARARTEETFAVLASAPSASTPPQALQPAVVRRRGCACAIGGAGEGAPFLPAALAGVTLVLTRRRRSRGRKVALRGRSC